MKQKYREELISLKYKVQKGYDTIETTNFRLYKHIHNGKVFYIVFLQKDELVYKLFWLPLLTAANQCFPCLKEDTIYRIKESLNRLEETLEQDHE